MVVGFLAVWFMPAFLALCVLLFLGWLVVRLVVGVVVLFDHALISLNRFINRPFSNRRLP